MHESRSEGRGIVRFAADVVAVPFGSIAVAAVAAAAIDLLCRAILETLR